MAFEYDEADKEIEISKECIQFNGIGDEGHETFVLFPKSGPFEFCKTARKPYDLAVSSVMILASLLSEKGQISSDGIGKNETDQEWKDAWKFVSGFYPGICKDPAKVFKSFEILPDLG